jgi:hypothetical protein
LDQNSCEETRLQVVVKVQRYQIEPNTSYTGKWHVEGITERIVAVGVYYVYIDDELNGGNLIFRNKSYPGESYDNNETYEEEFEVNTGTCVVFSNDLPHRVTEIYNKTNESRTRLFVDFFVVDPNAPLNEDNDVNQIQTNEQTILERRDRIRNELNNSQVGWGYTCYGNCGTVEFIDNKSLSRCYDRGDFTTVFSGNLSKK